MQEEEDGSLPARLCLSRVAVSCPDGFHRSLRAQGRVGARLRMVAPSGRSRRTNSRKVTVGRETKAAWE